MKTRIVRRALTGLAFAAALLVATSAHGLTITGDIVGLDLVHQVLPQLDGVDDATGAVQRVAILDTGIDYDHPALDGRVVGGVNYAANALWGATDPASWDDRHGHGTFVSGIVGSGQAGLTGMLPRIEFVSVRVLAQNGQGSLSDVASGLNWVAEHADQLNITAVNLSLGTDTVYASPDTVPNWSVTSDIQHAFDRLEAMGLVTVVASGNSGSKTGMSFPAILDGTISVGAVNQSDHVAGFTNRNELLDLLAPGSGIESLWKNGLTASGSGTSYAAPWVTGASMLLREAYLHFTDDLAGDYDSFQDRLIDLLQHSGKDIYDPGTGQTFARLDLAEAINLVYEEFGVQTPIPEPATLAIMAAGLITLHRPRLRRRAA